MYMYLSCIFTGASSVSLMTCSGCGSLSTDPRTYYYSPRVDKPIVLHCEITQLIGLVWTAPQLFDSVNRVAFLPFSVAPIVTTRGFATFVLVSIEDGPGEPQLAYCETSKKVVYNSSGSIFVLVLLNYTPWLVHVVRSTRTALVSLSLRNNSSTDLVSFVHLCNLICVYPQEPCTGNVSN